MGNVMELISSKYAKILVVILCVVLVISLVCCSGKNNEEKETLPDPTEIATDVATEAPTEEPTEAPTEATPVDVSMGTVTAGELNIRKGANSGYEKVGSYKKGDRIEILETEATEDGTVWGRTHLGWVGMGYVRMDGVNVPTTDEDDPNAPKIVSDGNSNVLGYGIVKLGELNVRLGPGTNYTKTNTVTMPNRYAYYQLQDGWARIEDGWVLMEHFYLEGNKGEGAFTAVVTTEDLNIRSGPNTTYKKVGTYKQGEVVEVLTQIDTWAYTNKGWVFITYLEAVTPTYSTGAGRVTIGLNIRAEANADSEIAGSYSEGDIVTIVEVDGTWGKTDKGWINLKYVEFS